MPNFILERTLNVNGINIFVKVTGNKGSEHDGSPFILEISGGPGFGVSEFTNAKLDKFLNTFTENNLVPPHVIIFDPLGCGKSSKAQDPGSEYTVENFTEISAGVVEAVKEAFRLEKMNLFVQGGSFGGLIALSLPSQRKSWVNDDSPIRLWQINSLVNINGKEDRDTVMRDLEREYGKHVNYSKIQVAMRKLLWGELKDQDEFIHEVVFNLAPLYADKNKAILDSPLGRITQIMPNVVLELAKLATKVINSEMLDNVVMGLAGCDVTVLTRFFKNNFNDYDLAKVIADNLDVYTKLPILTIGGNLDHIANPNYNSKIIRDLLPQNVVNIIVNGKHSFTKDLPEVDKEITRQFYIDRNISEAYFREHPREIGEYRIPEEFNRLLSLVPRLANIPAAKKTKWLGLFTSDNETKPVSKYESPRL